jgi:hypothetical protein
MHYIYTLNARAWVYPGDRYLAYPGRGVSKTVVGRISVDVMTRMHTVCNNPMTWRVSAYT